MKKTLLLWLCCLAAYTTQAQNITDLDAVEKAIKPGTQLIYDVTFGGKTHQLTATLKKYGDEIAFSWKTNESPEKSGDVTIATAAVKGADAMHGYLNPGSSGLDKETALWLSQKLFNEVAANAAAAIKMNGHTDTATLMSNTIAEVNFNLNGNLVAIPAWELEGGSEVKYKLMVVESGKAPLIYRLDVGWSMVLTEIKEP